jgi:acetyl-CoA carboxylase beta subunit
MKWGNLYDNKCPKCGYALHEGMTRSDLLVCQKPSCDFSITKSKKLQLTSDFDRDSRKKSEEFEGYGF